jgi:NADPH2:quinone reductase
MRAVRVHGQGEPAAVLRVDDVDAPEPAPGRVRVLVGAAAANLPDVMMCRGSYPIRPERPFVLGLEAAGTIDRVGDDVDPALVGTRVVGVTDLPHGGFAEHSIIPADRAYRIPDRITDADAVATLIAFQTAHVALHRRGCLATGETVLVLGAAGGVGSAAIQLAKDAGARVIAVAGGDDKHAHCRDLGADAVVDSSSGDLAAEVRALTEGRGVDVVYDPVGGDGYTRAVECVATDARVLLVGFAGGVQRIDPGGVLRKSYAVIGVYVGAYSNDDEGRRYLHAVQADIFSKLEGGRIRAVIDRSVDLDGVAAALEDLAARRVVGKIVVAPSGDDGYGA